MKWFKHISDSADDPDIDDAMTLFGSNGYVVFFRTLELMAREFDINNPGVSTFSVSFYKKKFRFSWSKIESILRFFEKRKRIYITLSEDDNFDMITLNCPKLKELCDEYTQKKLKNISGGKPDIIPTKEKELDKEIEEDKDKSTNGDSAVPLKDIISNGSIPKVKEEIQKAGKELYDNKIFIEVFAFINKMLKEKKSERAILHSLTRCYAKAVNKGGFKKDGSPWAYCTRIMQIENGNFNEAEYRKTT